MCQEECPGGWGGPLRLSSAVEVEEGKHAYPSRESLNGVGAHDCRLSFRGRGEGGWVTWGGFSIRSTRAYIG